MSVTPEHKSLLQPHPPLPAVETEMANAEACLPIVGEPESDSDDQAVEKPRSFNPDGQ